MKRILLIRQRFPGKQDFPIRLFGAAFAISLLITIFSGWQAWQLHSQVEVMSKKHVALTQRVGRIMLLDEVLTMSARMAAATGDSGYEKRYDQFDPQLTREINAVRAMLPRPELERFVGETDHANRALVNLERQAFMLANQGKRAEAMALLNSADYMGLKKVYAGGMEKTVNAATDLIEKDSLHMHVLSLWLVAVSAVGTLLLLATWFFSIRSARRWAAERREAGDALREAQDELVRKEKLAMLGQVAGSVGHELRNPLGVMSNAVYFLQTMLDGADASVKEYLGIIRAEIARSELIVASLMDAVRTRPPELIAFGLPEMLNEVIGKRAMPASVTVAMDIPDALPAIQADAAQMQQVFENLVSNAIDAMPEGGMLEIRAREDVQAGEIIINVRDTGSGIAPENMARLFQPLFTTKARGIGLGLVVAKNLVEANGGTLTVESKVDQGTRVTVTLQAAEVQTS